MNISSVVRKALDRLTRRPSAVKVTTSRGARFRLMYERFREILSLNDTTLQLIADIEDRVSGRRPFSLDTVVRRVRKATLEVFVMVKNLNQIAGNRYGELYETLRKLNAALEAAFPQERQAESGPLVVPVERLQAPDAQLAGSKMANLGEVRNEVGLPVPPGFVITTNAFVRFMSENELWERAQRLESLLETHGAQALAEACREVQRAIMDSPVPTELAAAILDAYARLYDGASVPVAMRSSAVGEDTANSHAGQYRTEINVSRDRLLDAYRSIVASTYGPSAVSYRFERGLTAYEATMAVGCIRMVQPRCSGIMFSRAYEERSADRVVVSATGGLAAGVASGEEGAEEILIEAGRPQAPPRCSLSDSDLDWLAQTARRLESHFGSPQDIEWAIDPDGTRYVLQTRPMVLPDIIDAESQADDREAILAGGRPAFYGAGNGPVFMVKTEEDLDRFPDGAVLVARHSSPTFSRVMRRCAAIVTDIGSPTGHMAILAREFGVPAIVGLDGATRLLQDRSWVTVDATRCRIYEGVVSMPAPVRDERRSLAGSPAVHALRRIAELVTPLRLTDPSGPSFTPAGCQSLHDVTRFVHESVFRVMFHYGELAASDKQCSVRLEARLPIQVLIFDVGGGIAQEAPHSDRVRFEELSSLPIKAFLGGMLDERIRWDQPRPVSGRGFLSVLGESMIGPPPEVRRVGGPSYAVISDQYMNFSTKAGYHFSTVDSYCGESLNKNYVHFRFAGGGADDQRRTRRVRFLQTVLASLEFHVETRGDVLVGRLEKYDQETICARLAQLGRLTMVARQMDMLMDSEASADYFARAFLAGEMERF
ncbi:MAG: PEP/pyruvate-binding domain-containing protein [Acidobacteriota bacterium]